MGPSQFDSASTIGSGHQILAHLLVILGASKLKYQTVRGRGKRACNFSVSRLIPTPESFPSIVVADREG